MLDNEIEKLFILYIKDYELVEHFYHKQKNYNIGSIKLANEMREDISKGHVPDPSARRIITKFKDSSEIFPFVLNKMILIYQIALMDGFISDIIKLVLSSRKEIILNSYGKKTINYEELVKMQDINDLNSRMICEVTRDITEDSIENQFNKIKKLFSIKNFDIQTLSDLSEICERRNLIVHNNGKVDEKYRKKYSDMDYLVGQDLLVDENYLNNALVTIKAAMKLIKISIIFKFGK